MKTSDAIRSADKLRPNTLDDTDKARFIEGLDMLVADMMANSKSSGVQPSEIASRTWPETDRDLLLPAPHDETYVLYLVAKIDFYNQDSDLYANDMQMYESAWRDAQAWWRRNNAPTPSRVWEV